jgi:hypothetical protein
LTLKRYHALAPYLFLLSATHNKHRIVIQDDKDAHNCISHLVLTLLLLEKRTVLHTRMQSGQARGDGQRYSRLPPCGAGCALLHNPESANSSREYIRPAKGTFVVPHAEERLLPHWITRWRVHLLILDQDILDNYWLSMMADATSCQKDMVTKIAEERFSFA